MAGHLSAIGFEFADPEQFQADMLKLAAGAIERLGCSVGDYAIWRSRTGAEIWFHLPLFGDEDEPRDIAGLTPFFEGECEVDLQAAAFMQRPGDNAFEGVIVARLEATQAEIRFEAVDFAVHAERALPFACTARLVGFAHRVASGGEPGPAATPGIKSLACKDPSAAAALCSVAGRLARKTTLVNEFSGSRFARLAVECGGYVLDVVAAPDVAASIPESSGRVTIECTLFGRILD
ncbi:MAG: hypothetical protein AB7O43_08120 [Hyphomicrobiaceae bacterium]